MSSLWVSLNNTKYNKYIFTIPKVSCEKEAVWSKRSSGA